ncbi:MAG: polyribonucleotide nucleotidyltransferase [Deltaproteobacteria bacterium]|nr:MAG: polyribonucleotide nucleotidyltransferase [Deltaproteobacteria bacterium]
MVTETIEFGGAPLTLETGRVAKQAAGSVLVTHGETVVLVTVTSTYAPRKGLDFFPLVVDVQERTYAAGKLPGGFFKREGRPTENATLMARLIDRPIRPLFPDGFKNEVQVVCTVLSVDQVNDPNLCGLIGASAALHISDIPWNGPIAGCVVGKNDEGFIACPTQAELEASELDLLLAARRDGIVMVEGGAKGISEDEAVEALRFGYESMLPVMDAIERLRGKAGKEKHPFVPEEKDTDFIGKVEAFARPQVAEAAYIAHKKKRYAAMDAIAAAAIEHMGDAAVGREGEIKGIVDHLKGEVVRRTILDEGRRIDGRGLADIREIDCQIGVLPRTHGSALFTRGETQALVTVTFGTKRDEQRVDALSGEYFSRFMLHYNFPPYSVGEVRMMRGPGRREIGHGNLARRGVEPQIPSAEEFPYTIRIVSEIMESNGSSSMASVCGSSLALMQAGVPVKQAVAGIAMGLITDGEKTAVLSDILGDEDHLGDMDFKVVGTREGITALQMDIKVESLPWDVLRSALNQAKDGRLHILGEMDKAISEPADDLSKHAPRIFTVLIDKEKIRDLIGPGGKHIRGIIAETGTEIDINDDGQVNVAALDGESAAKAIELIRGYTEEPEVGKIYLGTVAKTVDFGAFITIMPGTDGLCHISELADGRVRATEDVVKEGDEVLVKVLGIDRQGKIKLSRRAALEESGTAADEGADD